MGQQQVRRVEVFLVQNLDKQQRGDSGGDRGADGKGQPVTQDQSRRRILTLHRPAAGKDADDGQVARSRQNVIHEDHVDDQRENVEPQIKSGRERETEREKGVHKKVKTPKRQKVKKSKSQNVKKSKRQKVKKSKRQKVKKSKRQKVKKSKRQKVKKSKRQKVEKLKSRKNHSLPN